MKKRLAILGLSLVAASASVQAQVEVDDMYFNGKDRAKLAASKPVTISSPTNNTIARNSEVITPINPTDSYSARNINPEYISQSKVSSNKSTSSAAYFTPDYTPTAINQSIYNNANNWNNFNRFSSWNNPYWGMGGFANPYNGFYPNNSFGFSPMWGYDPYFNGFNNFYSPFSPFYDPWGSSLSLSMGWGWGNNWGNNWMYGSSFYNNYYGFNSWNNWGWNNNFYNHPVVVINNNLDYEGREIVYGKRSSRSSDTNNPVYTNDRITNNAIVVDNSGRTRGSAGRVSNDNTYYQRGWRSNPEVNPTTNWSNGQSSNSGSRTSSWGNSSRSGGSNDFFNNNSRNSGWSGGSDNSSFSSGGGSRSSMGGGSSGGGSSSGARRGRD